LGEQTDTEREGEGRQRDEPGDGPSLKASRIQSEKLERDKSARKLGPKKVCRQSNRTGLQNGMRVSEVKADFFDREGGTSSRGRDSAVEISGG